MCINQNDTVERSQQVRQMARIYSGSARLLIWLGERQRRSIRRRSSIRLGRSEERILQAALKSSWFTRRWVIQEYCSTPYHSRYMLQGSDLWPAHYMFDEQDGLLRDSHAASGELPGLLQHDGFAYIGSTSLLYNLYFYEGMRCSVEHDIVYSLLALSGKTSAVRSIAIDYTQPIEDCFIEVAQHCLMAGPAPLHNLCAVLALAATRAGADGLPSWVPDWRRTPKTDPVEHTVAIAKLMEYYGKTFYDMKSAHDHMSRGPPEAMHNQDSTYGRLQAKVLESWQVIDRKYLIGRGRIVRPCLPPQHIDWAIDEVDRVVVTPKCWSCQLLSRWARLRVEAKSLLEAEAQQRAVFLVLPYGTQIFVVRELEGQRRIHKSAAAYHLIDFLGVEMNWRFSFEKSGMFDCFDELDHILLA